MNFLHQAEVFLPILLKGVHLTILVTVGSLLLSTVLGLALVFMRVSGIFILSETARLLTNVLRGIPAIVQLFYVYFVFPEFGITLTALQAGIIGLGIAASPFQAENFRAGIEAVDKGQIEAALTIGMSWGVMMRRVILPQAIKVALPPYGNNMVMLLKDSSLASTITVGELTLQGKLLSSSTFENTTIFTLVALLYLCMSIPLIIFNSWLERKFSRP